MTIQEVIQLYKSVYYLPDEGIIPLTLAVTLSGRLPGDSIWLMIVGPSSGGKCLGKGTPVIMYDGTVKNAEDIVVGDVLMGDDSTPRNVLSITHGKEDMYRICQARGEDYVVNKSHILSLTYTNTRKEFKGIKNGDRLDVPLTDLLSMSEYKRKHLMGYKTGVEFRKQTVGLDPYFLGVWLGDGNSSHPAVTSQDEEIIKYLHEFAGIYKLRVSKDEQPGKCISYWIVGNGGKGWENPVTAHLRSYNLIKNKHIPHQYKNNSTEVRMNVLAGLLDTDGSLQDNRRFDFINKNERLARDVVFLARSLGFRATIHKTTKRIKARNFVGIYWRVNISGDLHRIPTIIKRKRAKKDTKIRNVLNTGITIKPLGVGDYYGFTIDGNHRFLLGDFTVTHNTEILNAIMGAPWVHQVSTLTANTLLSGAKNANKETSLAKRIGNGVITMKDFTTILSMPHDLQQTLFAQLRELYDGYMVKETGTGDTITWKGKINLIAGVTEKIHTQESKFSGMGTRALQYTLVEQDRLTTTRRAQENASSIKRKRLEVQAGFTEYLLEMSSHIPDEIPELEDEVKNKILIMSDFASRARSPIERGFRGEMQLVLSPEMPMRMSNQMYMLGGIFTWMYGELTDVCEKILYKIALDSIPKQRRITLRLLAQYSSITTRGMAVTLKYPTETVRQWLEDCNVLGLCDRSVRQGSSGDSWQMRPEYRSIMEQYDAIVSTQEVLKADDDFEEVDTFAETLPPPPVINTPFDDVPNESTLEL